MMADRELLGLMLVMTGVTAIAMAAGMILHMREQEERQRRAIEGMTEAFAEAFHSVVDAHAAGKGNEDREST